MKLRATFRDATGKTIAVSVPVFDGAGAVIGGAIQNFSAASHVLNTLFYSGVGTFDPHGPSSYPAASDVADLAFQGNGGHGTLHVLVPAPIDAMFLGDLETVDPVAIASLITAIQTFGLMPDGGTSVGSYLYGFRRKLTERKY